MLARSLARMSRPGVAAALRTQAVANHLMSTSTAPAGAAAGSSVQSHSDEAPVLFETNGQVRKYILNRPKKLNALDESMLEILRPGVEEWSRSNLSKILVGTGVGRAFCAGGDVASVVKNAADPETRPNAIRFFQREFEMDYILAAVPHPYIAIMDGITMGGGFGLSANAIFRVATENTVFAMPETKIGYCPDVGASYFLPRCDGELGTYLGLTGRDFRGRAVFEHGFATHFVPSRRIPALLERLASLDDPTHDVIDSTIEDCYSEREPEESRSDFVGTKRAALDSAFRHNTVEEVFADLQNLSTSSDDPAIRSWAQETLDELNLRSPTSLKVALMALRKGKSLSLLEALQMELNIATAYCNEASPDFRTGVTAVLIEKMKEGRPAWSPSTIQEVNDTDILTKFFSTYSPVFGTAPTLTVPDWLSPEGGTSVNPMRFALPTEEEIGKMVSGNHPASGELAITLDELVTKFERLRKGKHGVREKVLEVAQRRCIEEEDKESGRKYLRWKH